MTHVDEIAPDVYRISIYAPHIGLPSTTSWSATTSRCCFTQGCAACLARSAMLWAG